MLYLNKPMALFGPMKWLVYGKFQNKTIQGHTALPIWRPWGGHARVEAGTVPAERFLLAARIASAGTAAGSKDRGNCGGGAGQSAFFFRFFLAKFSR